MTSYSHCIPITQTGNSGSGSCKVMPLDMNFMAKWLLPLWPEAEVAVAMNKLGFYASLGLHQVSVLLIKTLEGVIVKEIIESSSGRFGIMYYVKVTEIVRFSLGIAHVANVSNCKVN